MITRTAHVGIRVKDVYKACKFYEELFGGERRAILYNKHREVKVGFVNIDDCILELIQYDKEAGVEYPGYGIVGHLAFLVTNIEKAIEKIEENNLKIFRPLEVAPSGRKHLFFYGLNGEHLQFIEDKEIRLGEVGRLQIERFEHVGIHVTDMKRSVKFYSEVLGFPVTSVLYPENKHLTFVQAGQFLIELIFYNEEPLPRKEGILNHVAFFVEDIDDLYTTLLEHGVESIHEKPITGLSGRRFIYFRGPDGEKLEFIQNYFGESTRF